MFRFLSITTFVALIVGLMPLQPLPRLFSQPVNKIIANVPEDLSESNLLIPRFDFMDPEDGATGSRRRFVVEVNKQAKKSNTTLNEVVMKAYNHEYKLASLSNIQHLKTEGYRYFMDMVLMPKQMTTPKKEAMVPAYEKYRTANKMYKNRYTQFHFYFYIRDLETNDAYITTRFKGNVDTYAGIKSFLKRVNKDIASQAVE